MSNDDDGLSKLVRAEAAKSGISSQQASKAIKMLRNGKVNISQVAPQLKTMIMKNMADGAPVSGKDDIKARFSAKRRALEEARQSKQIKKHMYEKTKKQIEHRKVQQEADKLEKQAAAEKRKLEHERALNTLESKLSVIPDIMYNSCLEKLQADTFPSDKHKDNCQCVVDLYHRQQGFDATIKNDVLDSLLEDDLELSDIDE